jgi:hypothetical protein
MAHVSPRSPWNLCHIALLIARAIRKLIHKINVLLLADIASNKKVYIQRRVSENVIVTVIVDIKNIPEKSFEFLLVLVE